MSRSTRSAQVAAIDLGATSGRVMVADIGPGRLELEQVARFANDPVQLWNGHRDKPNEILIKDPSLLDATARDFAHYPGGHPEGYPDGPRNLFRNLYRYIRGGKKPGTDAADFPTFEDGHAEVVIVEKVLESHATNAWVDVAAH